MYWRCSSSSERASSRSLLARTTSRRSDFRTSLRAEETSSLSPIATPSRSPTTSAMKTAASDSA
jgi:hypothetical protein